MIFGRPRHPQSQGQVERLNQTIKRFLSKCLAFSDKKRWIDSLDEVVYSYNKSFHRAINTSPFNVFLGTKGYNVNEEASKLEYDQSDYLDDSSCIEPLSAPLPLVTNPDLNFVGHNVSIAHKEKYENDMIKYNNKNHLLGVFKPGSIVYKLKDFSTHQDYVKRGLDTLCEEVEYIVVRDLNGEMVEITKKGVGNLPEKILKSRLKKLNK